MTRGTLAALACAVALLAACASEDELVLREDGRDAGVVHLEAQGALGPYSGAVLADGFVFASGKIGERGGAFEREAETAIVAVEAELARADCTLADIVSSTVYLTDMALYGAFNAIWAARLPSPYPARACVAVAALPGGARVEISVIARRPRAGSEER